MKTYVKIALVALFIGGISVASCKKYEDGPAISVLSKKSRISNTWAVEKYMQDGVDKTSDYRTWITSESYVIDKSGSYTYTASTTIGSSNSSGTWEFINDKEDLKTLSSATGATPDTMIILRLKNKELWLKTKSGSPVEEIHYIAK